MLRAGLVFFVGDILSLLGIGREPNWFLFIPYLADSTHMLFLKLAFLVVGLFLIVGRIGTGLYYYRDRGWYMRELSKANNTENLLRGQSFQIAYAVPKIQSMPKRKRSVK